MRVALRETNMSTLPSDKRRARLRNKRLWKAIIIVGRLLAWIYDLI
jgi:hypothetical protein